jgi:glycosyl-4,4'-diaponeurosporenoate acyltransferase
VIELSPIVAVASNIAVWLGWSVAVGYIGHRRPLRSFATDRWWSRLHRLERGGSWYARTLRIKAWKDRLPELGGLFAGGFAKRGAARDGEYLERFVSETRRAEWVHWTVFLLWPVFALWNPPWAVAVMFMYATVVNAPCLLVQRYNRARILHALAAMKRRDAVVRTRLTRGATASN